MISRLLKQMLLLTIVIGLIGFALLHLLNFNPPPIKEVRVASVKGAPVLAAGQSVTIMSWNVQFMAGNKDNHFFFSGGDDDWSSKETVLKTLDKVVEVIRREDPDVVLLQEVDDHSVRTHYVNQVQLLLRKLPQYQSMIRGYYWKSWFVPHPAMMGPGVTQLLILSKYKINRGVRHALPSKLNTYYLRHFFEAKRAVLEAVMPVQNSTKPIHLYATHLSAFAQGNDTMTRQIAVVRRLLEHNERAGEVGIIGGDFNLLASPALRVHVRSPDQKYYDPDTTALQPLLDRFKGYPSYVEVTGAQAKAWYTQMPTALDDKIPDKTIDYFFVTKGIKVLAHRVVTHNTHSISDHFPIMLKVQLPTQTALELKHSE